MKYVFLVYQDEKQWEAMPPPERDALEHACQASEQDLRQSGFLFAVEALQSSRSATTVRVVNGRAVLTGGPFAATQAELTRLFFINARDLNEAIRVASKIPLARTGAIEVRPVLEFDRPLKSN